jgi:hypothetical protein
MAIEADLREKHWKKSPVQEIAQPLSWQQLSNWQAREISRIVKEYNPEEAGIDISLLAHISPIEWSNVVLYGEYKLNRDLVKR